MGAGGAMDSKEAWETPIRHFCESVVDPTSPEYWSAFSSLGITAFALLCLFTGHHNNALVKLQAAVLAWCGIGSFGFHWTLSEAWSFLDTFPMTVAAVLGMYLSWIVILDECGALLLGEGHGWQPQQPLQTPHQSEPPSPPYPSPAPAAVSAMLHLRRSQIMSTLALVAAGLLIWSLVLNVVYGNVAYDNLFTGLGLVLIASALGIRACHRHRRRRALLQRRRAVTTTTIRRCYCSRRPAKGQAATSSGSALVHRAPLTSVTTSVTTTTTTCSEVVAVEDGVFTTEEGDDGVVGGCSNDEEEGSGIAMAGSASGGSSSSSSDGSGHRGSWDVDEEEGEAAAGAESDEEGDSLAAALLPRRRRRRPREAPGEEAWVVEVRMREEAYMTFLGGETQALSVVLLGLVLVAVAAVVWETSEQLCPDPRFHWLRFLRLHSLWHLAIGYGVFLLLQASAVLSAPGLYGRHAMFDNRHFRWPVLNTLLPRVVYGAPVPTAAHATSIAAVSSLKARACPKEEEEEKKTRSPPPACERCGGGRLPSVGSAATASTASASLSLEGMAGEA